MTTIDVSVLMPCKGRAEQTAALLPRLIASAGGSVRWELICIVDGDAGLGAQLSSASQHAIVLELPQRRGYWRALAAAMPHARGRLLANIANDVLPGLYWLARAYEAYQSAFGDGEGVLAFNDGLLLEEHAGHLLCSRALLERWYGPAAWPVCYDHMEGDVEICTRAMEEDRYALALKAVLFHNHWLTGLPVDPVYEAGLREKSTDHRIWQDRFAHGWPPL